MSAQEEIADLRGELDSLRSEVASLQSELAAFRAGGPFAVQAEGGIGTPWAIPPGYMLPSGGGGGGGVAPFAIKGGKITNRWYMVSRTKYEMQPPDPDVVYSNGLTTYYLVIPHSDVSAAEVNTTGLSSTVTYDGSFTDKVTVLPLYAVRKGRIEKDYRGMPIAMLRE